MATEWIKETAAQVLPHLVQCARLGETIEYGQLAKKAGMRHHRPLPNVLCYIRDEICIPRGLPRLSVIVVNKELRLPGENYLEDGTGCISKEGYLARFHEERDAVLAYKGWKELLANMGLQPLG